MRADLELICSWIAPKSRVLDLGCGDGKLLAWLTKYREVQGFGLEIDAIFIAKCLERRVNVIEQNLDLGLHNFADNSFDVVIMTQSLQALKTPHLVLDEMLRIGKTCIITFPNFGHWKCRAYLAGFGKMPVSKFMPYEWYDTPNIHFCTFSDFENLCKNRNYQVLERLALNQNHQNSLICKLWPNLLGEVGVYKVTKYA